MQKKGYTIPELIAIIVIVGIFSILAINKASYAFVDNNNISKETQEMILIKTAKSYASSILETLKNDDIYITGNDLKEANYLVDDDHIFSNVKIKLSYNKNTNTPNVEILNWV